MKFPKNLYACPLFASIEPEELDELLALLGARLHTYAQGEPVLLAGQEAGPVGIVLRGSVQVVRTDVFGSRSIIAHLTPSDLFGETFACAGTDILPVEVTASAPCEILLFDLRRALSGTIHPAAPRVLANLLGILAGKNLVLSAKNTVLSARGIRGKVLAYLSMQARQAGNLTVTIPFNRQELADYLCADRSALSAELSRMQKAGLLTYRGRTFTLPPAENQADYL